MQGLLNTGFNPAGLEHLQCLRYETQELNVQQAWDCGLKRPDGERRTCVLLLSGCFLLQHLTMASAA